MIGMPEIGEKEQRVLELVREYWPISALEVAQHFSEDVSSRDSKKRHSTNYAYYLKKLIARRLVLSKRVGNALIVWPVEVEAYRTIHGILRDSHALPQHHGHNPSAEEAGMQTHQRDNGFQEGSAPAGVR